ncbi:hypothetical protein RvY_11311 [Ramazzottius varieornatus]|uniref:Uncharacterized protein n=1 Tax=Ramazzottius varieornatus TaxID=947166 RepID=A0A1D1VL53_RAMVA|nr:hypothetical protein RvY_11311 [Ramazzottius varieornatus]
MSTIEAGSAADAAEKRKISKYRDIGSQFLFCPGGLETLGPWEPCATEQKRCRNWPAEEEKADLKEDKLLPKKRKSTHRTEAVESSVEEHNDVDPGYPETIEGAYGMVNLKELGERMFEKEKARSKAVNLGMEILFSQEEILNGACKGRGGGNREFTVWDPQKLSALYGLFCEWSQRKGLSQPSEKNFHQICINNKTNKRKSLQLTEH